MAFNVATVSCMNQNATHPMHKVLDIPNLKATFWQGDIIYMDSSSGYRIGGVDDLEVCYWDFAAAPTGAPANAYTANLFKYVFDITSGTLGPRSHAYYWSESKERGILNYWQPDDHESWDNIDHTASSAGNKFTIARPNQIHTITTQAQALGLWDLSEAGHDQVLAAYFDNPARTGFNGDIPSAMVGVATASKYRIRYFYKDFDADGNLGGNCVRFIVTDEISYKSPISDPDNTQKQFHGQKQTAWILETLRDAKAKGMPVVMVVEKDYGNNSNLDGPTSYRTATNALLTQIETEDLPVAGWICGDKHTPHASLFATVNGDAFNALFVTPCPFGQNVGTMAAYAQLIAVDDAPDGCVVGQITVDAATREITFAYLDAYTLDVKFSATVPFMSRVPSRMTSAPRPYVAQVVSFRASPATPASGTSYQNTTRQNQLVNITGGTLTNTEVSTDNTTFDALGAHRQVILGPNHYMRLTYTGTITLGTTPI